MVIIPFTLPYKWVCSKCKLGDIYWQPFNGLYFCSLCKVAATCTFDIHINTTIEVVMVHHAFPMSKILGCFPCSNSNKRILWQNIIVKKCLWSNSLEIWKFLVLFTWVQLGNLLDTMRNSNLKNLQRLLEKLLELFLVFELFGDFVFIEIFCCSSLFLYVYRSLLHIVRPHL